jgi:hypothetical protein
MSVGQEEIKNDVSAIQDKTSADISAICCGQENFEEKVTET